MSRSKWSCDVKSDGPLQETILKLWSAKDIEFDLNDLQKKVNLQDNIQLAATKTHQL